MNKIKNLTQIQFSPQDIHTHPPPNAHTQQFRWYLLPPPASIQSRQDSSGQLEWLSQGTEGGQSACEGEGDHWLTTGTDAHQRQKGQAGDIPAAGTFSDVFWRTRKWCVSHSHPTPYTRLRSRGGREESHHHTVCQQKPASLPVQLTKHPPLKW